MSKILTIVGTRPEIIRLSRIIPILDKTNKNILVHTGQNYDYELDEIFFKDLDVRKPDYYLGAKGSFPEQLSIISKKLEKIILKEKPEKFVVLGDTNSSLGAIIAKRLKIKVYHLEAGNRSYLKNSPEEVNRKIIDHVSDINLPYTYRSCENLVSEGIIRKNIFVIGNPIFEVMNHYANSINNAKILDKLKLEKNKYVICTLHREENVENSKKFSNYLSMLNKLANYFNLKIVFPLHPRTKHKLKKLKINLSKNIIFIKPLGFIEFACLEKNSKFLITDSGTVQEEASILNKICLVFRDATERPETIENGNTIIINKELNNLSKIKHALNMKVNGNDIREYKIPNVSNIVSNIINSDILI